MENNEMQDRGLLDLSVELSTRDVMAGNDFTLFVLIKNPFAKPIYVRRVHVSLPSELRLALANSEPIKRSTSEAETLKQAKENQQIELEAKIESLTKQMSQLTDRLNEEKENPDKIKSLIESLKSEIRDLHYKLRELSREGRVMIEGGTFDSLRIAVENIRRITVAPAENQEIVVRELEITEPWLVYEGRAQTRQVELESSLPKNTALQPGNTVVYSVVLNVRKSLLFSPSKYRLQFNANYSFQPPPQKDIKVDNLGEEGLFTNTIAYELSIRSSIYSVIFGSAIGGFVGGIARILQVSTPTITDIATLSNFVTMVIAVILSMVAIVFMARKSDSQSFVSVEDFWGGLLVGFLVGYTGTSFFESLTGINTPTP